MAEQRRRHLAHLLARNFDGASNTRHNFKDGAAQRAPNFENTWCPLSAQRPSNLENTWCPQSFTRERTVLRRTVSSSMLQAENDIGSPSGIRQTASLPQLLPAAPVAQAGASPLAAITTPQSGLLARRASARPMAITTERRPSMERRRRSSSRLRVPLHDSDAASTPGGCSPALQPLRKEIQWLPGGQKIFDLFSWKEVLQEDGDGGKVVVCQPKVPCDILACRSYIMKMRSKKSLEISGIPETFRKSQERLLNLPSHVGVLPLHKVFEDDQYYYLIMERAEGGAFLPSLVQEFEDGIMPESEVKRLVREILEALCHLHSQGMLHRDIKPDNLVMQWYNSEKNNGKHMKKVALIDFDHADPDYTPLTPQRWGGFRGTVHFSAPDAICGDFSPASDLYSVGVVLYLLMTGHLPYPERVYRPFFEDARLRKRAMSPAGSGAHPAGFGLGTPCRRRDWKADVVHRMRESPPSWDCSPWPELPNCRAFCQTLMAFDARQRPATAEEALAFEWFTS